jgi:NAD(P)-dependent dehydrogenase (short-subunit alcohol dehydrogenase family)
MTQVTDSFGRLDIVVANAGVVPPWHDTEAIDLDEWDRVFAINVRGVMATIKHAVPLMKQRGGSILVMGSTNSWIGHPKQAAYTASKHAVLGIVRAVARDVGRFGIRVNALGPGPVATEALLSRIDRRAEQGGAPAEEVLRSYGDTLLGRMPTEEDVVGAALFLASDLSSGITGQLIPVDAGGAS